MKKVLSIVLVFVLCFGLYACDDGATNSVEDKVRSSVESYITVNVSLRYDTVGVPTITSYISEIDENTFEVSGKVTVKDKYGDSYTGNYDATVVYNPEIDDCDVDCTIQDLYKD